MSPIIFFASYDGKYYNYYDSYKTQTNLLATELPKNIHLLTLQPWSPDSVLLRLENYYQKSDDTKNKELTQESKVDIKKLFGDRLKIKSIEEKYLNAIETVGASKLKWNGM